MIKLGIIGTGWISKNFVSAAIDTKKYKLCAVYSREVGRAEGFASNFGGANCFDDLDDFINSDIEAVYIASPNSLHYEHALRCIKAKKHVIVEKPAFSTIEEMSHIVDLSQEMNVLVLEAARHIYEKNFQIAKKRIAQMDVQGAFLTYMKYSSRYDQVLEGREPNIFSPKFSGGSLADLGIYLIYAAVEWFGLPKQKSYYARKTPTGVDGRGIIIFNYDHFDVVMQTGKMANSFLGCEIQSCDETLMLDSVGEIRSIVSFDRKNDAKKELAEPPDENGMKYEADVFADLITNMDDAICRRRYLEIVQLQVDVNRILVELRKDAEIFFDADLNG